MGRQVAGDEGNIARQDGGVGVRGENDATKVVNENIPKLSSKVGNVRKQPSSWVALFREVNLIDSMSNKEEVSSKFISIRENSSNWWKESQLIELVVFMDLNNTVPSGMWINFAGIGYGKRLGLNTMFHRTIADTEIKRTNDRINKNEIKEAGIGKRKELMEMNIITDIDNSGRGLRKWKLFCDATWLKENGKCELGYLIRNDTDNEFMEEYRHGCVKYPRW
ncbi:hypothetical protein Cni_G06473 [Canna indica]|uniref:Uncharacterized protein n=1 Tax=Canna indica TaxID=4628 RepID=A0AAQ3Q5Z0_9LILI|nr:hypothetical protein Cni_G06473 [Canna indica]